jgi:NTP pyrophosphatase (non-canonical NTP hydrolase)
MIDEGKKFEVLKRAVLVWGDMLQTDILVEEMAELTKAIIKSRRHNAKYSTHDIMEELADVQICLDQLKMIAGKNWAGNDDWTSHYEQMVMQKITRLEGRLDNRERSSKGMMLKERMVA